MRIIYKSYTTRELAQAIKHVVGFKGRIVFDTSKPDGACRKLTDVSRLSKMGWNYNVDLTEGIEKTYRWYLEHCV